jgi:hypothetical protein
MRDHVAMLTDFGREPALVPLNKQIKEPPPPQVRPVASTYLLGPI